MARRYQALARDLPALRAADQKWRDQAGGELLLDGSSDAVAAASLQTVVKALVEEAGGKLSSSEVLVPTSEDNFRRVGIRVMFSGDLKLVTAVLRGMETSRPILSVGDFSLRAGGGGSTAAAEDSQALLEGFKQFQRVQGGVDPAVSEPATAATAKEASDKAMLDKFMQWQQRK